MKRLKVALIGLSGVGTEYLSAIQSDDQFTLLAVADTDAEVLRRQTEATSLRAYQDYRSLVVETAQSGLDLLFVALEPFQSIDYLELAAARGIGVFHKAPPARTVEEARRLVRWFDEGECPLVVSRPWQFDPAFDQLRHPEDSVGRIYAGSAAVRTADGSTGWRGDSLRAGSGVLLNGAYQQVDMLVHLMGMPIFVDAQCCTAVAPGKACNYDTEDAAQLAMRFTGERIAAVTASRNAAEPFWQVTLIGERGAIDLDADRMVLRSSGGGPPECHTVQTPCRVGPAISAFGATRLTGMQNAASTAKEHLATMAVIEAAYLSAKTGTPESPDQFLSEKQGSPTRAR